jgi:hypothetical protein
VNDRPDSASPADDSPEIAEVRRLLADARHTEPMPAVVASRLDDVLADLSSERSRTATPAPAPTVIPIAARRRRRAAGMLVAAAAIVVGGVTFAQNVHLTSTNGSASTAEDAPQADSAHGPNLGNTGNDQTPQPTRQPTSLLQQGRVVVHPRHFSVDALEGRQLLGTTYDDNATKMAASCTDLAPNARVVPAEYRRAHAALVYRRPEGSFQVVELILCGTDEPIRTTRLPAP